jgi:hypothetical protein
MAHPLGCLPRAGNGTSKLVPFLFEAIPQTPMRTSKIVPFLFRRFVGCFLRKGTDLSVPKSDAIPQEFISPRRCGGNLLVARHQPLSTIHSFLAG